MSEYTPGPWGIEKVRSDHARIWGPENTFVAETYRPHGKLFSSWANAQLIAAAPELLEALELVQSSYCLQINSQQETPEMKKARTMVGQAILKAKGEKL